MFEKSVFLLSIIFLLVVLISAFTHSGQINLDETNDVFEQVDSPDHLADDQTFDSIIEREKVDGIDSPGNISIQNNQKILATNWNSGETILVLDNTTSTWDNITTSYRHLQNGTLEHNITLSITNGDQYILKTSASWNITSIEPNITVSESANYDYYFTANFTGSVTLFFKSGTGYGRDYMKQKEILAISDVSDLYLQDSGFEINWSLDWANDGDVPFDSIEMNNTIVGRDGSSSVKISATNAYYPKFDLLPIDNISSFREYYISFDLYFENIGSSDTLRVLYYSVDGWIVLEDLTISDVYLDRWMSFKYYLSEVDIITSETTDRIFMFYGTGSSDSFIFFLDNFKLYQVSTEQSVKLDSNDNQYLEISSDFAYWTDYGIYPYQYGNVTLELWERELTGVVGSEFIADYNTDTDENGNVIWNYYGYLTSMEYEIRVFAWDSYVFNDLETLQESSAYHVSGAGSVLQNYDVEKKEYNVTFKFLYNSYVNIYFNPDEFYQYDYSIFDYFYVRFSTSAQSILYQSNYWKQRIYISSNDGNEAFAYLEDIDFSVNLKEYFTDFHFSKYSPIIDNNPDLSLLSTVLFGQWNRTSSSSYYTSIMKDLHFIHAQKSYFTPLLVSASDYVETELGDAWDFSEGDKELLTSIACNMDSYSYSIENGMYIFETSGSTDTWCYNIGIEHNFDVLYWNIIQIRAKTNATTDNSGFYLWMENFDYKNFFSLDFETNWQVFETDITNVETDDDGLKFTFLFGDNNTEYNIDYIRLVHKDSSLIEGRAREFEEETADCSSDINIAGGACIVYNFDSIVGTPTEISTTQGFLQLTNDGANEGIAIKDSVFDNFDSIWIEGNLTSVFTENIDFVIRFFDENSNILGTTTIISQQGTFVQIVAIPANTEEIYFYTQQMNSSTIFLEFIRFVIETPPNMINNQFNFQLQNLDNFNLTYLIQLGNLSDAYYQNQYWTNQTIPKNITNGPDNLYYMAFNSSVSGTYLPTAWYSYYFTGWDNITPVIDLITINENLFNPFDFVAWDGSILWYSNDQNMSTIFTINVDASDTTSGIYSVNRSLSWGENSNQTGNGAATVNITFSYIITQGETSNDIIITVYDQAGNTATTTIDVELDNTAPDSFNINLEREIIYSECAYITTITSDSGIGLYHIQLNIGISIVKNITSGTNQVCRIPPGDYTIYAQAFDLVGNMQVANNSGYTYLQADYEEKTGTVTAFVEDPLDMVEDILIPNFQYLFGALLILFFALTIKRFLF